MKFIKNTFNKYKITHSTKKVFDIKNKQYNLQIIFHHNILKNRTHMNLYLLRMDSSYLIYDLYNAFKRNVFK